MTRKMQLTRELVNLLPESIEDPGEIELETNTVTENFHADLADEILSSYAGEDNIWVFAIGSLIWKPCCDFAERRPAKIIGWQRAFSLGPDTRYRGNPDAPGLMLTLNEGGSCEGVAFRLGPKNLRANLVGLLESEPPIAPEHVCASTDLGAVNCIAFVCPTGGLGHEPIDDLDQVARRLSKAVGMYGSMPDYLLNTIEQLAKAGIHDAYLWDMQERVAKILALQLK